MKSSAYSLLAEPIRRVLWNMGWNDLRPVQEEAIPILLQTEQDLLISARTAAGKTEAAFLPILSQICATPAASVRAIYVGPLKALINDQFRRVEDLCLHAQIPVHRWHGDVSSQQKKNLLKQPSGVLLITPESIESLFVNQGSALHFLFHSLSFVVIDELHAMIGCERGTHLRSLLYRIDRFCLTPPRMVALSATLGDLQMSKQWMRPNDPERVQLLEDHGAEKAIRFRIFGYQRPSPQDSSASDDSKKGDSEKESPVEMTLKMYRDFRESKNLIFVNSRADVEWYGDQLNQHAKDEGTPDRFLVHHGSLSRQIREHTESLMLGNEPHTTVCTATLELGIDIGNVAAVGQVGCPWTVASMIQRLGRSGREDGQAHSMRLYIVDDQPNARSSLCERLFPQLIQSVAVTELMLQRWAEPPEIAKYDFSTMTQQILSVIAQTGGLPTQELHSQLVTRGAFQSVELESFESLLRSLGDHDLIEQMTSGELILGLAGERIVRHYDFYSAFATAPEYRIVHQSTALGTVPIRYLPAPDDHLLFAGRRWLVVSVDDRRKEIVVTPARGRKKPRFQGGSGTVHPTVREMMRNVLSESRAVAYLNEGAAEMLAQARQTAQEAGLLHQSIVPLSNSTSLWFTWTGSRAHRTLELMAKHSGIDCTDHQGIAFEFSMSQTDLRVNLQCLADIPPDPMGLAALQQPLELRKYDEYVDQQLLLQAVASEVLDIPVALQVLRSISCTT